MLRLPIALITALLIATGLGTFAPSADTRLPFVLGGQATASTATTSAPTNGTPTSTSTVTPTPSTTATATTTGTPTQTGTPTSTGTTTNTPTITQTPTSTGTSTTTPTVTPTATATEVVNATCDCSGNVYNCPNFDTQPQAQACFNYCVSQGKGDIHGLDTDDDGEACEGLPGGFTVVR